MVAHPSALACGSSDCCDSGRVSGSADNSPLSSCGCAPPSNGAAVLHAILEVLNIIYTENLVKLQPYLK